MQSVSFLAPIVSELKVSPVNSFFLTNELANRILGDHALPSETIGARKLKLCKAMHELLKN